MPEEEKPGLRVTVNDASETIIINNDTAAPPKPPKGATDVNTP